MDLSKLPKFSNPQSPPVPVPPPAEDATTAPLEYRPVLTTSATASLADAWISIGIGAFLLLFEPRFLQWTSSRIFHTHFNEFVDSAGNIVPYTTVPEFWSDLGPTLFGIVLIVDGLMLFTRRRSLVLAAFVLTTAATIFNLVWVVVSYSKYGLAVISCLAVVIGGYTAMLQWRRLQESRR